MNEPSSNPTEADVVLWRQRIRSDTFGRYHLEMGIAIRREGNLAVAEAALQRAIDTEPLLTDAYFHLGQVLEAQGRVVEAQAVYARGRSINPGFAVEALAREAIGHLNRGGAKQALTVLEHAEAAGPPQVATALLRAVALHRLDRETDALAAAADVDGRLGPAGDLAAEIALHLTDFATALADRNRIEEALALADQACALDPNLVICRLLIARVNLQRNDLARAQTAIDEASRLNPHNPLILGYRGSMLNCLGRTAEAEATLREGLERLPDNPWLLGELGNALISQKKLTEAVAVLRQAARLAPQESWIVALLGATLRELGQPATRLLSRAVCFDPANPWILSNLGLALSGEGFPSRALAILRWALACDPGQAGLRNDISMMLLRMGRYAEAETEARAALASEPGAALSRGLLGMTLIRLGRGAEGEAALREVLKIEPDAVWAMAPLGARRLAAGALEEAATLLAAAHAKSSNPLQPLAMALLAEPDTRAVADGLERLATPSADGWVGFWLGITRLVDGADPAGAVAALQTACDHAPDSAAAQVLLGLGLLHVTRIQDAMMAVERGVSLDPQGPWRTWRGLVFQAMGRLPEAEAEHRATLEAFAKSPAALVHLAATLQARGRTEEACRLLRTAMGAQFNLATLQVRLLPPWAQPLLAALAG